MSCYKIVLAFDFGMKYIGIASGNTISKTGTAITSIKAKDGIPNWQELEELIASWDPDALIVGVPLNMDGTTQELTFCAKKFIKRLKQRYKKPVLEVDERLSTWEAKQIVSNDYNKINAKAAQILVEQWIYEK